MAEYQHGLCGCFDDCGLCILTFFVPCYSNGKNAEAVGENCILCGLVIILTPLAFTIAGTYLRGKIREKRGIRGSVGGDFVSYCCCTLCSLMQDAQEVQSMLEYEQGVIQQDVQRE